MGYHRAGFEVVGVDVRPQPFFPFEFHQADALDALDDNRIGPWSVEEFDVIHASPPCQRYTSLAKDRWGSAPYHDDLIAETRALLQTYDAIWVIENVPTAPLRPDVTLCGSSFGLGVRRHRWFELSVGPLESPPCRHSGPVVGVFGHTGGTDRKGRPRPTADAWRAAMGTPWMSVEEMSQALPPRFTEWLGRRLLDKARANC